MLIGCLVIKFNFSILKTVIMNAKKQRKMKKSKAKRAQRTTVYDPNVKSKYSEKKARQAKGVYSPNSPFRVVEGAVVTAE